MHRDHSPWMDQGSCTQFDPELWHPTGRTAAAVTAEAVAICTYSLQPDNAELRGIWGGLTREQRTTITQGRNTP